MSTAIQTVPQMDKLTQWKRPGDIKARIQAIQELMAQVLKPATKDNGWDGDYGAIPGTGNKPSLLKSGSEQILAMFEIAVDPVVEDLSTEDCQRYRVTARLIHVPSGNFLGAGIGEASTDETKYKWKRTYSKGEFDHMPPDRRRIKYSSYKNNNGMTEEKEEMQIRTEPADLGNTVLKMAKKRAQIDATLTVTGASSMFQQDLEEDAVQDVSQERSKGTRGKKAAPATQRTEDVRCASCGAVNGHLPSCKYHPNAKAEPSSTGRVIPPAQPKTEEKVSTKATKKGDVKVTAVTSKKSTKGTEYLELGCEDDSGNQGQLFVWHKHLHEHLANATGQRCVFDISSNTVKDKTYFSVEHIHSIGAVKFEGDKPLASPSGEDLGFGPSDEAPEPEEAF